MKFRKTMLAASIVAALGFAGNTAAQDVEGQTSAPAAQDQATDLDAIVVTGIRASLQKSLQSKRSADAVTEVLTAEDIGDFPNTNVAEAMAMIPGVSIDRRFGQGERVSIDGTDPSLNLTYLDGHPVAQAIWLYGEQPNRGFDQTQIASEIIGRLEVYKSPEARLPAGSLGGMVLMHTRKPFDLEANSFTGSVGYNYSDQASEGSPSASVLYSWKNDRETFGFNVAAQHYEEHVDRQGLEIFGYAPASSFPNVTGVDPDAQAPNFLNAAWFQQERERDSIAANLQFRPTENLEFNLNGLYIKEDFANYNQSVYNWLTLDADAVDSLTVGPDGVVTGGHVTGGPVVYDSAARVSEPTTKGLDLQMDYDGDGWGLSAQVGQSEADNVMRQYLVEPIFRGDYSWNINTGITFDDVAASRDPANWGEVFSNNGNFFNESKDSYGQIDFSKQFNSVFNLLQVGVRRHEHEEDFALRVYGPSRSGTLADVGTVGYADTMDGFSGFSPSHGDHIAIGRDNTIDWVTGTPLDPANPDPSSFINNTWSLEQVNTAAYAQLDFSADRVRGNMGLRYVKAEIDSTAYNIGSAVPVLPAPAEWLQTSSSDNGYWLPSANVVFEVADDLLLRFAAAKVVAWAPYNQYANNTFLNDTVLTGSGGNSALEAYESTNINAAIEWYFADEAVLAASVFYKRIDNFVETTTGVERFFNTLSDDADQTRWNELLATGACTADGFCDYDVLRPRNAGEGKVKGFNLSYQQPFGDTGFGVLGNYTYADGESAAGNDLPYQSQDQVSLSPYYERGPFSARLSYNWRSDYLAGGYVAGAPPVSVDAYGDLGASLGWEFSDNLQLSLDAQNLLDEKYFQYFGEERREAGYRSRRSSSCGRVVPLLTGIGSHQTKRAAGDEMALDADCVVDGGVHREKALGRSRRLEVVPVSETGA